MGVRRRLKRDAQGSAHEHSTYLKFLRVNAPASNTAPAEGAGAHHDVPDALADSLGHGLRGLDADELVGPSPAAGQTSGGGSMEGPGGGGKEKSMLECEMVTSSCIVVGCLSVSASAITFVVKRAKNNGETFARAGVFCVFCCVHDYEDDGCESFRRERHGSE